MYENTKPQWSESHQTRTKRILEQKLYPAIGSNPMGSITPSLLINHLRQIEALGTIDTAYRTKQVAGQVFRYAIQTERASCEFSDPATDLKSVLAERNKSLVSQTNEFNRARQAIEPD